MNVGTLTGRIELENDFSPQLANAVSSTNSQLTALSRSFKDIGSKLSIGVTLPLTAAAAGSLKLAGDFESAMTRLVSTAGVADDEIDDVKKHILDLAPKAGIGPNALADAMLKVSSTVSDTKDALEILDIAAQGTKAGFGETVDVAGALTAVINSYGSANITAARAGDILAQAIKDGGAEANELAPTLANVVPFASQLGVSFEEVAANIATMTKLGVPTAEAVTSLTSVFSSLTKETDQGSAALAGMGMSYGQIREQIREKGLAAALTDLSEKFKGNETVMVDVFGRIEAVKNVMGTAGAQAETYAEVLGNIKTSSDKAKGAMQGMADAMSGKQVQTWKELRAEAEVVAIQLGNALAPALASVLENVRPMIGIVGDLVKEFTELPQPIQTGAIAVAALAAALGPMLLVAGSLTSAWVAFTPAMTAAGVAVTAMSLPVRMLISQIEIFGLKTGIATTAVWTFDMTLKRLWASMLAHPIVAVAAAIGVITAATVKWYESTQEAELASQEAGAKQDVINRALQLGADKAIKYEAAIKFVADANRKAAGYGLELKDAIHNLGNDTGNTNEQLRDLNTSVLDAGKAGTLSTPRLKEIAGAINRLGVDSKDLPPALKNIVDAVEQMNTSVRSTAIPMSKEMTKAINEIGAASVPLTKTQREQILTWDRLGVSASTSATALGVSSAAVERAVSDQKEMLDHLRKVDEAWIHDGDVIQGYTIKLKHLQEEIPILTGSINDLGKIFKGRTEIFPDLSQGIKGLRDALASSGIFEVKTYMPMGMAIQSSLRTSLKDMPKLIIDSFTGGGGLKGAVNAIGGSIGASLTSSIFGAPGKGGLLKGLKIDSLIGDMLGSALPGIGALAGPAVAGLGKLVGKFFGTAGRDAVKDFANSMGGFDTLHKKLGDLGSQGERLWISLTQGVGRNNADQARAAIAEVTRALEDQEQAMSDARASYESLAVRMGTLTSITPELESALEAAMDPKNPQEYSAALADITRVIEEQDAKQQFLNDTMAKYGLTWKDAGEQARAAHLATEAANLEKEFVALRAAGIDVNNIMRHMGKSINDIVTDARKTGTEVPESFRDVIQTAMDAGEIFDENGVKITDMKKLGIEFGTTMETATANVATAIERLAKILEERLGPAIKSIPDVDVEVRGRYVPPKDFPDYAEPTYAATGAKIVPFPGMPRGSDRIPVWTSPGERVLSVAQNREYEREGSGTDITIDNHVIVDGREIARGSVRYFTEEMARTTGRVA